MPPGQSSPSPWRQRPILVVLGLAALVRLLAAVFAKGYGMHDDHFFVVEVAQRWVEGHRDWLGDPASYHGLFYPGLHFLLFAGLERAGVADPQQKMLVVRLLHAAWSMLTVYYGYRTAEVLSGPRVARLAGLFLALLWLLPFLSVRNLVEVACQPPLAAGAFYLVRDPEGRRGRDVALSGALFGLAFCIRFQTAVMAAAVGLTLLALRRYRAAALFGVLALATAALVQGGTDWVGYGRPFSSVLAYLAYNSDPANIAGYPQGPWHRYIGLLAGVLVPPLSLCLLWGFLASWRRSPLLFWPTLAFLVFHSAYPGKQERFVLPALPFLAVLGVCGFEDLAVRSAFWLRHPRLRRGIWAAFWVVNLPALLVCSTTYSKRTRVEALSILHGRADVRGVVLETSEALGSPPPLFYLDRDVPVYQLPGTRDVAALAAEIAASARPRPNYVVFTGEPGLDERLQRVATALPGLELQERVDPSFVDWLAHRLNPKHNTNLTARIYRSP